MIRKSSIGSRRNGRLSCGRSRQTKIGCCSKPTWKPVTAGLRVVSGGIMRRRSPTFLSWISRGSQSKLIATGGVSGEAIGFRMCSIITHPIVPISIAAMFPNLGISRPILLAGTICSVIPDLDVIGFSFGIKYGDMLGHRGVTHSIFFAVLLGGLVTYLLADHVGGFSLITFMFLVLSTLSHGVLDALTNGGLGVAFFSPFQNKRYFFPWRPILVSPIGVASFLSETGLRVLWSELQWVWFPCGILYGVSHLLKW